MNKYLILPLRTPDKVIFSWLLFCPNGNIFAEDNFKEAVWRMDDDALKSRYRGGNVTGKREIAKLHLNSLYGKFASNPNKHVGGDV